MLAELGVVLALEPLSPRTTNFMTTAAQAVEVAELVDSPLLPPAVGLPGDEFGGTRQYRT